MARSRRAGEAKKPRRSDAPHGRERACRGRHNASAAFGSCKTRSPCYHTSGPRSPVFTNATTSPDAARAGARAIGDARDQEGERKGEAGGARREVHTPAFEIVSSTALAAASSACFACRASLRALAAACTHARCAAPLCPCARGSLVCLPSCVRLGREIGNKKGSMSESRARRARRSAPGDARQTSVAANEFGTATQVAGGGGGREQERRSVSMVGRKQRGWHDRAGKRRASRAGSRR